MNIYYLSATSFFQVDKEIIHELALHHRVHYGVVVGKNQSNFSRDELLNYCTQNKLEHLVFNLGYRQRDLRLTGIFYKIVKEIKRFNPDIVYIASFDHPIFSMLSFLLKKSNTIIGLHDVELHSNFNNAAFHNLARSITLRHFKYYQAFSKGQAKLFSRKYQGKTIFNIPLQLSDYGSKHIANTNGDKVRFLFFGNILPYKGLDILIHAANNLAKRYPGFELVIAGRCDQWNELYQPLVTDNKQIVTHIGFISNEKVADLFSAAQYLVLPYKDATQSGPLMIAYNYDMPVIASRLEAFEEYVKEDVSGYFFDRNIDGDLEAVMERAILRSGGEYAQLAERLQTFVSENFSRNAVTGRYNKMFSEVYSQIK